MTTFFIRLFMPLVTVYHLVTGNLFLNTTAPPLLPIQEWGDFALIPTHYLLAGEQAIPDGITYRFEPRFDYNSLFWVKLTASLITLPLSVLVGSTLKGLAYFNPSVRQQHQALSHARTHIPPPSSSIATLIHSPKTKLQSLNLPRSPKAQHHLAEEKEALKAIVQILQDHNILFWADCGTCLGAYRYGGVIPWDCDLDIAVLQPDFDRIKHALQHLPQERYIVQDWSSRIHPKTLLKVYVRSTQEYIDIYHFQITQDSLQFILSHADNILMPQSWKVRESRFTAPTPITSVFPLKYADFDGIELPVPNDTERYLQQRYGDDLSPAKYYDPDSDSYLKDPTHPYWQREHAH